MKTALPAWIIIVGMILTACQADKKSSVDNVKNEYPVPINDEDIFAELESSNFDKMDVRQKIDPHNLNVDLLVRLIEEGINLKRIEEGRMILRPNSVLADAATHQNNYQIRTGQLSHTQANPSMRNVQDRVNRLGGSFRTVGENVQFQGFQVMISNGQRSLITPAYQKAAQEIVDNWINSPGHYRNLINDRFDEVGTAVAWSDEKNAIFATQVFGG